MSDEQLFYMRSTWESSLGVHPWNPPWGPSLGVLPGSPPWESSLGTFPGNPPLARKELNSLLFHSTYSNFESCREFSCSLSPRASLHTNISHICLVISLLLRYVWKLKSSKNLSHHNLRREVLSGLTWHSSFGKICRAYWKITLTRSCCKKKSDVRFYILLQLQQQ